MVDCLHLVLYVPPWGDIGKAATHDPPDSYQSLISRKQEHPLYCDTLKSGGLRKLVLLRQRPCHPSQPRLRLASCRRPGVRSWGQRADHGQSTRSTNRRLRPSRRERRHGRCWVFDLFVSLSVRAPQVTPADAKHGDRGSSRRRGQLTGPQAAWFHATRLVGEVLMAPSMGRARVDGRGRCSCATNELVATGTGGHCVL